MNWTFRFDDEPEDRFGILVPGLFGIGFLISLAVLVADAVSHLFPTSGRRRRAMVAQVAKGRANELTSLSTGRAPQPARIERVVRTRLGSLALAALAVALAATAVVGGLALAAEIGAERKAWATVVGFGLAAPLVLLAAIWLLAAAFGPRSPRWLRALHTIGPIGAYPELSLGLEEGWR